MKVGDRVRFLNSVGGGIVTKIGEKGIVQVMEDDGFEVPMLAVDLVVVPATNEMNFAVKEEEEVIPKAVSTVDTKPDYVFDEAEETIEGEQISLYLAFLPKQIKSLQTSAMDLYLVNDSNYYVQYQLLLGRDEVDSLQADFIEPQTKILVCDIEKEEVNDFEFIHFQGFAFKKGKSFSYKKTVDCSLRINPVDFYKLHRFTDNDFFEEKAMVLAMLEYDNLPITQAIDTEKIKQAMLQKQPQSTKKEFAKPKKNEPIEIDLHIEELVDSTMNMSNFDMLTTQMNKFRRVMNDYQKVKGQRIVFIHGKGEGVLRKEIISVLNKEYKKASFQDASFQKYGFGATMVIIH